jgi:hypothetical protein
VTPHPGFHVYSNLLCHKRDEADKTFIIVTEIVMPVKYTEEKVSTEHAQQNTTQRIVINYHQQN